MTSLANNTSRFKIEDGAYDEDGEGKRRKAMKQVPVSELDVGQNVTIPSDLIGGDRQYLQTIIYNRGFNLLRRFRTKTQSNGDLKVYRVL